ncbi:unnamed protein product [Effrenium voratum]|nr:unnamed protein product [Effrenium voratum]
MLRRLINGLRKFGLQNVLGSAFTKQLLRWDLVSRLMEKPDRLSVSELLLLARQFFALHALLGLLSLFLQALAQSVTVPGLWNVAFPLVGMHFAKDVGGANRAVRWWIAYWLLETLFTFFQTIGHDANIRAIAAYGLQWFVLARLWCWLHVQQSCSVQFYLNIVIESGREHFYSRPTMRSGRSTSVDLLSDRDFSDDKYISRLAEGVERMICEKLRDEAAMVAKAKKHFQRGNLIVVLVTIERVDMRRMLELKGEQHRLRRVDVVMRLLRHLPVPLKLDLEQVLLSQICRNMIENVPSQLTRQMCEIGGVNVDVEAKGKDEQADFLLEAMRQLDEEDILEAKNRHTIAVGGDEVWPFFCGYGHAKVRHVPTTACYPRQVTCSISPHTLE